VTLPQPELQPRTPAGAAGLAAVLDSPSAAVVAVDFDGTLAPIVARPEDARPAAGALKALTALCGAVGRCAVVTGRGAEEAVRLGGLDAVPGLEVLGHYGLQRWVGGRLQTPPPSAAVDEARTTLAALVAGAAEGVHLEDKEHSLVVHTRPAADPAGALAALIPQVTAVADRLGLETVPGRFVVEVRPPGVDKGLAVRRLVEEVSATAVVYVGDDLGDLPAFAAVEAFRNHGGAGLTVASVGPDAPPDLAERADLVLDGPEAVVAFLAAVAARLPAIMHKSLS
jgi:trehalose 6-phosphate phosphatase